MSAAICSQKQPKHRHELAVWRMIDKHPFGDVWQGASGPDVGAAVEGLSEVDQNAVCRVSLDLLGQPAAGRRIVSLPKDAKWAASMASPAVK